ncbi:MAG: hypothetical protein ACRCST_12010, partial [Turicibacter sp.]
GLPVTLVEAQANGLMCFVADNITKSVDITAQVNRIESNQTAQNWADFMMENRKYMRMNQTNLVNESGFGIETTVESLRKIYRKEDADETSIRTV